MFDITQENNIQLVRGDSVDFVLFINGGTELCPFRYELQEGDKVFFALMEVHQLFEDAILKKVYTKDSSFTEDGNLIIHLSSDDTEHLHEGLYKYTIKLKATDTDGSDMIRTLVTERDFYIVN